VNDIEQAKARQHWYQERHEDALYENIYEMEESGSMVVGGRKMSDEFSSDEENSKDDWDTAEEDEQNSEDDGDTTDEDYGDTTEEDEVDGEDDQDSYN
jgi:hypothetical protein